MTVSRRPILSGDPELLFICSQLRRRDCWIWTFYGRPLAIMNEGAD